MPPKVCMREIETAMVKIGADERFFNFKTLTPTYSTCLEKVTDPEYWDKFEWTFKKSMT